ncbi:hypothetical protein D9756_008020 [Leucocoprinus leucothites]|uniref:F-box domain-containing protein n=1 Tax=Leucocoprinus leucothites TaxID=201217 RepID=A0A8H5D4J1_9AGAR|nr:hypothetical protein D9756_008020 [Leucoagaricus leucothites]
MAFKSKALERKLRTNDPPTNEEAAIVRTALTSSVTEVAALESEAIRLQSRLNKLVCEKQQLSAFVKAHRALLAPVRSLHPDILQEIFYHCLPTAHNTLMSNKEAPIVLGLVCRQWREIAYSTPRLWTSIHIIASPSAHSLHPLDVARREAIASWLSRSGALPLSISVSASGHKTLIRRCGMARRNPSNNQVQPYLDLIIPYVRRWRSVFFSLAYFDWVHFLNQLSGSQLPMLQSLHIEGDRPRRRSSEPVNIDPLVKEDSILSAPSLRVLSLPTFYSRFLQLRASWEHITGLDLGARGVMLVDIDKALRWCPNLESCRVSVIASGAGPDETPPLSGFFEMEPLTLSKLQSLHVVVRSSWNTSTCSFLERLTTPALVHLSYEQLDHAWWHDTPSGSQNHGSSEMATSLCSFLKRLTYPLEELEFTQISFSGAWVMKILPLVPSLKRLSLKGFEAPVDDPHRTPPLSPSFPLNDFILSHFIPEETLNLDSLKDLASPADERLEDVSTLPCFCPNLEVLHCVDATFSRQALLQFLRARTVDRHIHNLAHIRRVNISYNATQSEAISDEEDSDFEREIRALEKETGVLVGVRHLFTQRFLPPVSTGAPLASWAYMGISPPLGSGYSTFPVWPDARCFAF